MEPYSARAVLASRPPPPYCRVQTAGKGGARGDRKQEICECLKGAGSEDWKHEICECLKGQGREIGYKKSEFLLVT